MTPLRQRMLEEMEIRNYSAHTKATYLRQVAHFARHFGRSPVELGPEHIRAYQLHLTHERRLATHTVISAVCHALTALAGDPARLVEVAPPAALAVSG